MTTNNAADIGSSTQTTVGALSSGSLAAGFTPVTAPLGGTGNTTFTAFSLIAAGTTATGAFQNVVGLGAAGTVLTSAGAGALPVWSALTESTWVDQTSTPVTIAVNTAYISDTAGLLTFNVPATFAQGQEFEIGGKGAGGWIVQFAGGQTGHLNSSATSVAGSFASTNQWNSIKILCVTSNTTFVVLSSSGTITVA